MWNLTGDPAKLAAEARRAAKRRREEEAIARAAALRSSEEEPPPDLTVMGLIRTAEVQMARAAELAARCVAPKGQESAAQRKERRARIKERKACLNRAAEMEDKAHRAREKQLDAWRQQMATDEALAQAKARGDVLTEQGTAVHSWLRDERGAMVRDNGLPVLVTERAKALRRQSSDIVHRLARFGLTPDQSAAAVRFEADFLVAKLEPKMIANLERVGGGSSGLLAADMLIAARDRVHDAYRALRPGGEEVVAVVEAIVVHGSTSSEAGKRFYRDDMRHNANVRTLLVVGLNLLAAHYRARRGDRPDMRRAG